MSVFQFENYFDYMNSWIENHPSGGRGLKSQIAELLGVSSSLVSLILSGKKHFTIEQAATVSDWMGHQELEEEYFLLLVSLERAGTHQLKKKYLRQIARIKENSKKISNRLSVDQKLSEPEMATYYSTWIYTAIRNLVATGKFKTIQDLSEYLQVSEGSINRYLQFLTEHQLVIVKDGQWTPGPAYTHINKDSPLVIKHWQNWRLKALQVMDQKKETDLFYTSPYSLSQKDSEVLRELLLKTIQEFLEVVKPSPSEITYCLNIDWFRF